MVHEALDLAAIRARLAAITRAPWSLDPDSPWVLDQWGRILIGSDDFGDILTPENAAFIAAAPAAVAALLAVVTRLHAALADLETQAAATPPGSPRYEALDAELELLYQIAGAA